MVLVRMLQAVFGRAYAGSLWLGDQLDLAERFIQRKIFVSMEVYNDAANFYFAQALSAPCGCLDSWPYTVDVGMIRIQMMFHREQVLREGAQRTQEQRRPRCPGCGQVQHGQDAGETRRRCRDEKPPNLISKPSARGRPSAVPPFAIAWLNGSCHRPSCPER